MDALQHVPLSVEMGQPLEPRSVMTEELILTMDAQPLVLLSVVMDQ